MPLVVSGAGGSFLAVVRTICGLCPLAVVGWLDVLGPGGRARPRHWRRSAGNRSLDGVPIARPGQPLRPLVPVGGILGMSEGVVFDADLLYVAAMLHDIGLVAAFDSHTVDFEQAGGHVAW